MWESKSAGELVMVEAVEGGPVVNADQEPIGMVLTLHGDRADDSGHVSESFVLTAEAMSAVIAHMFTAARQLGPQVLAVCQAATTSAP